jgi:transposase
MPEFLIGIDVAKDTSSAQGIDSSGKRLFSLTFAMDSEGFVQLWKIIVEHNKDLSRVLVAVESTACYHINLYSFLMAKGVPTVVINPLLIANFTERSLRKTKADKKDAMTIAQFLLVHQDSISQLSLSQDLQDFRDIARERESVCNMLSAHKVEVKRLLQSTFPELERIGDLSTRVMQEFIAAFPSARLVKMAKPKAIQKILQRRGVGTRLTYTAEDIMQAAKRSVATLSPAKEFILQGKVRTLQHLRERYEELTKILTEYCKSSMLEDFEIITSIDGISKGTATTFLAEIGCIGNFASHKKLIAFAGIDPTGYQSGKFEGSSRISKRGNRHLRRVIWLMTTHVVEHNATFRAYYMKKRSEGQPFKKAVFATAHKLIRLIYAMLTQRTMFREVCT